MSPADLLSSLSFTAESSTWLIPTAVLCSFGAILGLITLLHATDGENRVWRLGRCLLGFSVAMIWIMAIGELYTAILSFHSVQS